MIKLSLALILALACPAHKHPYHKNCKQITIMTTTADFDEEAPGDDTGGDKEHIPLPPPPPTHP
jgi:hypothetical protein